MPGTKRKAWLRRHLGAFGPAMGRRPLPEILRAALGVGLAMAALALAVAALHGGRANGLYLVSGLASSAALLLALPNSPLAQPWSALVGMMVSALAGVAAGAFIAQPWAIGAALALALLAMMAARALHPPAAGVALFAVLEAAAGRPLGWLFPLVPVALSVAVLIGFAMVWHRLTGLRYPNRLVAQRTASALPEPGVTPSLDEEDLEAVLLEFRQSANVSPADLARLTEAVAARMAHALLAETTVEAIMRPAVSVGPDTPLTEVLARMRTLGLRCLPVADAERSLLGMVDQRHLIDALEAALARHRGWRLRPALPEPDAARLMSRDVTTVEASLPVAALLAQFSLPGAQPVPVLRAGRLAGMVGRADLVALILGAAPGFTAAKE